MSDNVRNGKFFAWCIGIRGLFPMKFHEGINKTDDQSIVQSHEISDLSLSFGQLAEMFPAPVSEEHPYAWPNYGKVMSSCNCGTGKICPHFSNEGDRAKFCKCGTDIQCGKAQQNEREHPTHSLTGQPNGANASIFQLQSSSAMATEYEQAIWGFGSTNGGDVAPKPGTDDGPEKIA